MQKELIPFNEWLKQQRENKAMSQKEFGNWVGVTLFTICNLEKGHVKPSLKLKRELSKKLKVDIKYINKLIEKE